MAEYSRIAKGHITTMTGGGTAPINLPFQPQTVKWWNQTAMATPTDGFVAHGYWDVSMGQAAGVYDVFASTGTSPATDYLTTASTITNGISTFAAGQSLQYGPLVLLGASGGAGIAKTSATVLTVTTAAAHGLVPGNWVVFQNLYQTSSTGMQQIAGIPFQVQSANFSTTAFQIAWKGNASNLTAITTAATGAAGFKQILFPTLYVPGTAFPYSITVTSGEGTVVCTAPHNFKQGQEIAFRIPPVYGAQNLNELPDVTIPGQPQYYYVDSIVSATSFTFANAPTLSSAFVPNATFASFPGLEFAQVIATGDVNTGGDLYSGGNLYPSPSVYGGASLSSAPTINGPAIQGAYINNTSQGFYFGSTVAPTASQVIYWEAELVDYAVN